eukprot:m.341800 g.341800  ORF g.341800 m.341800 type:complete len:403 (-) comp20614_c0_seq3:2191-3399(-)
MPDSGDTGVTQRCSASSTTSAKMTSLTSLSKLKTQYIFWSDRMAVRTAFCFGNCFSRRSRACLAGPVAVITVILFFAGLRGWWLGLWPFGAPKMPSVYLCPPSDFLRSGTPIPDRYITGTELQQIPRSKINVMENGVPKILHQTWSSHQLLAEHQRPFASWEACLPDDWLHVLWSDTEAQTFVETYSPRSYLSTYKAYAHVIQRVDSFRYVLLGVYGGMYADLDNECMAPPVLPNIHKCKVYLAEQFCNEACRKDQHTQFKALTQEYDKVLPENQMPPPLQNSLMISPADHWFWNKTLDVAIARGPMAHMWQRWTGIQAIQHTTGIDLLSIVNFLAQPSAEICTLPKEDWHGLYGEDCKSPSYQNPKYVHHHGSHVWTSSSSGLCWWIKVITLNKFTHFFCG